MRTWPEDWEARKSGERCPFCADQPDVPFYRGRVSDAYLERRAVSVGHSILIFRGRHVADFIALSPSEAADLWADVQEVGLMTQSVFQPCHLNYELLGNSVPHIHVHVLPRYVDDPAPGRPLPWEPRRVDDTEFSERHQRLSDAAQRLQDAG